MPLEDLFPLHKERSMSDLTENQKIGLAIAGTATVGGLIYLINNRRIHIDIPPGLVISGAVAAGILYVFKTTTDKAIEATTEIAGWLTRTGGKVADDVANTYISTVSTTGNLVHDAIYVGVPWIIAAWQIEKAIGVLPSIQATSRLVIAAVMMLISVGNIAIYDYQKTRALPPPVSVALRSDDNSDLLTIIDEYVYALVRVSTSLREFVITLFMYMFKDAKLIVGEHEIVAIAGDEINKIAIPIAKLIFGGGNVKVGVYSETLKSWVLAYDLLDNKFNNDIANSIRQMENIANNITSERLSELSTRTKNNMPTEVTGDIYRVIRY